MSAELPPTLSWRIPSSKQEIRHGLLVILILALASAVAACSSVEPKLAGLLADPIANYEAEGIELIRSWQEAEGRSVFGTSIRATVDRVYRVADQDQLLAVLHDAVSFAESEGWRMEEGITRPTTFVGEKQLPAGPAMLTIGLGPGEVLDEPDGTTIMSFYMHYIPVSNETTP